MENQKIYYEHLSQTLIKNMQTRGFEAYYVPTKEEATTKVLSLIQKDSSISWGGSMTLETIGLLDALREANTYTLLDRSQVSHEELPHLYRKAFSSDYYLMSSNAITLDGKLVNIDGTGNRTAALIYGPKEVLIIAGMNKVATHEAEALQRVHNVACPQNAIRLNRNTPCAQTGTCHDCLSPDCICSQIVITRNTAIKGRIKVILVGEHLGY